MQEIKDLDGMLGDMGNIGADLGGMGNQGGNNDY